jgi:hypothetical protein
LRDQSNPKNRQQHTDPSDPFGHRRIYQAEALLDQHQGYAEDEPPEQRIAITRIPTDSWQRTLSALTLAVLVATLIYVEKQWDTMDRQWKTMDATLEATRLQARASIRAVEEARKATAAAIDQSRIAGEALKESKRASAAADVVSEQTLALTRSSNERAYRAWLTVQGSRSPKIAAGSRAETRVFVENTGRTAAQNIEVTAWRVRIRTSAY